MKSITGVRPIFVALLMVFALSCKPVKVVTRPGPAPVSLADHREKYKVVRIDSIEKVFVIYARKDKEWYKIVSIKDGVPCRRINVGEEHAFVLMPVKPEDNPFYDPHINIGGTSYYGVRIQYEGDSIKRIYTALNVTGLCVQ
jgi:hypothetical protein